MRNRITTVAAVASGLALIASVAWAALPNSTVEVSNEHMIAVSDAGAVVLAEDAGSLAIVSVETNAGWTHEVELLVGREVEADFRSGDRRIQFNAELEDGVIRVRIRERDGSTRTEDNSTISSSDDSSSSTSTTSSTIDDSTSTTLVGSTSTTIDDNSDDDSSGHDDDSRSGHDDSEDRSGSNSGSSHDDDSDDDDSDDDDSDDNTSGGGSSDD